MGACRPARRALARAPRRQPPSHPFPPGDPGPRLTLTAKARKGSEMLHLLSMCRPQGFLFCTRIGWTRLFCVSEGRGVKRQKKKEESPGSETRKRENAHCNNSCDTCQSLQAPIGEHQAPGLPCLKTETGPTLTFCRARRSDTHRKDVVVRDVPATPWHVCGRARTIRAIRGSVRHGKRLKGSTTHVKFNAYAFCCI